MNFRVEHFTASLFFLLPLTLGCGPVTQGDSHQLNPTTSTVPPGALELHVVSDEILGHWRFVRMRYQNQDMPPRDPRLLLSFDFSELGESRLYWTFNEGRTFCERKARYQFQKQWLEEKVVWVNPVNMSSCGSDPDMQLGRETKTQAFIKDSELWINIGLGDEDFFYIWQKQEPLESRQTVF